MLQQCQQLWCYESCCGSRTAGVIRKNNAVLQNSEWWVVQCSSVGQPAAAMPATVVP
jgi:hypothetical protein